MKKIAIYLLSCLMVLGLFPTSTNNLEKINAVNEYQGYEAPEGDGQNPGEWTFGLYARPKGSLDQGEVVYCFNWWIDAPDKLPQAQPHLNYYTKVEGHGGNFSTAAQNPRVTGDTLENAVERIIYDGYPQNKSNLMAELIDENPSRGQTIENQFRMVTQYAIWYYTDSNAQIGVTQQNGLYYWGNSFDKMYLILTPKEYAAAKDVYQKLIKSTTQLPAGYALNLFLANQKTAGKPVRQNLLSTALVQPEKINVEVSKKEGVVTGAELQGAKLEIRANNATGTIVVPEWTTDGKTKSHQLPVGTYALVETEAPKGYLIAAPIIFTVNADGKVTVDGTNVENNVVVMVDKYADQTVKFSKTDVGGKELPGAELTVTKQDGTEIAKWISTDVVKEVVLQPGTYTMTEKTAPKGYIVAESITFTVNVDGTVTVNGTHVDNVVMVDKYADQTVKFSKTDVGGKELPGAELTVTKQDGTEIAKWISTDKVKEIMLQPGTYTMTEKTAPKGYVVAESITFTVNADGTVTVNGTHVDNVVMVDKYADQTVKFSKTDVGGKELPGAELTVTKQDGTEIAKWISTDVVKEVVLQPGTYTMIEKTAPKGYVVAESITFTVNVDGTVTVNGTHVDKVVMVDKYADQTVKFSKTDVGGKELPGAKLTVVDASGKEIARWISTNTPKEIMLQPGTYTMIEKTAPKGYVVAESITFTVNIDGTVTIAGASLTNNTVVMVDAHETHPKNKNEELLPDTGNHNSWRVELFLVITTAVFLVTIKRFKRV